MKTEVKIHLSFFPFLFFLKSCSHLTANVLKATLLPYWCDASWYGWQIHPANKGILWCFCSGVMWDTLPASGLTATGCVGGETPAGPAEKFHSTSFSNLHEERKYKMLLKCTLRQREKVLLYFSSWKSLCLAKCWSRCCRQNNTLAICCLAGCFQTRKHPGEKKKVLKNNF